MKIKTVFTILSLLCAGPVFAYQQAPVALKTVWGEKVTPENAWRDYPRPQMVRDNWTNLNGLWKYAVTTQAVSFPKTWDGEILVPFVIESSLSGVGRLLKPNETLWYRRELTLGPTKPGSRTLLHFEQADFRTQVFVNGREAGVPHEGGQMPFTYDVTGLLKEGANELTVVIWDPTQDFIGSTGKQVFSPGGCMYTRSSGIGGTVWMETVPETSLTGYHVTTDIDAGTVSVTLEGTGNLTEAKGKVEVVKDGKVIAKGKVKHWGRPVTIKLPTPIALWSPDAPALYDLVLTLKDDETDVKDIVKGYFGMRKLDMRKDPNGTLRFYLNNKNCFVAGTLDQGWWPDGLLTPPSEEAMAFDILALKKMGFNAMRKHIKVEPRRYYALCDRLGLLVLQDMPSGGGDTGKRYGFYRRELAEMINCLRNVPSIVMWIPYNEGWGQPDAFLTHSTLDWVKNADPTRLVDGPSGWNDYEGGVSLGPKGWAGGLRTSSHLPSALCEAADIIDRHDYGTRPQMFDVNERRASFLGEFGGIGCRVSGHLWTEKAWGYGDTGKDSDRRAVQGKFVSLMGHVACLAARGLAGSIYTQTTDVEAEINGLITYDRKVIKFDSDALAAAHRMVYQAAESGTVPYETYSLFPKLDPSPSAWAYTFTAPAKGWEQPDFDDAAWKRSAGGFGGSDIGKDHPHAKIATPWNEKGLWLRRRFTTKVPKDILRVTFEMFHDEDTEIWLNGRKVLAVTGYTNGWNAFDGDPAAFKAALRNGENVLAVKVIQTVGGQYFDTGLSVDIVK